jgi:mono/diheme cytochrome c family protein
MRMLGVSAAVALIAVVGGAGSASAQQVPGESETAAPDIERFEDGDAARGEKMYLRYCRGCHGVDGRGGAHTFMPHIGNLAKKDHIEFLPDSYLFTVIAEGGTAVGKSSYMPAWRAKLSEQDVKDIIAHIRTLPTY